MLEILKTMSMKTWTVILSHKIQRGRCAGALADAEENRDVEYNVDGAPYRLDQVVAKTSITKILVTYV